MRSFVDHVDLVVSSVERSRPFYLDLLAPLGVTRAREVEGERGETIWYLSGPDLDWAVGLRDKQSDAHATPYDRYAIGVHHVAFQAPSREVVDECARRLAEAGAEIESGPAEYGYHPGYYALFLRDPDGIKLEIMHVPDR